MVELRLPDVSRKMFTSVVEAFAVVSAVCRSHGELWEQLFGDVGLAEAYRSVGELELEVS